MKVHENYSRELSECASRARKILRSRRNEFEVVFK